MVPKPFGLSLMKRRLPPIFSLLQLEDCYFVVGTILGLKTLVNQSFWGIEVSGLLLYFHLPAHHQALGKLFEGEEEADDFWPISKVFSSIAALGSFGLLKVNKHNLGRCLGNCFGCCLGQFKFSALPLLWILLRQLFRQLCTAMLSI